MSDEIPAGAVELYISCFEIEPSDWVDFDARGFRQVYSVTLPLDDREPVVGTFTTGGTFRYSDDELVAVYRLPLDVLRKQAHALRGRL